MLTEEEAFRDDLHSCGLEVDIQVSDHGDVILADGLPIDKRQFIFDERNPLFSYDNAHNGQMFVICKSLFNHKLRDGKRVYLPDVLDYLMVDMKQRAMDIKELYWDPGDTFDFKAILLESIYDYPVEKDGYVLAFNVKC